MNLSIIKLSVLVSLLTPISIIQAQVQKGELVKDRPISSKFDTNEKHQYTINLNNNQFAFFKLMQDSIDLKVTTYNTQNEKLDEFDSPNYRNGYELFTISTDKKGKYIIEIESIDEKNHVGNYELFVQSIKPKAVTQNEEVDELFTVWDTNNSPGAAVAVVKDGEII